MKVVIVLLTCLVASAYSRQIVIKYVQQPESDGGASTVDVQKPKERGILSDAFHEVGNFVADTADTAGRIAQGIVEVPATLVGKTIEEAGKGAAKALRETGKAAEKAVEHVEHGIDNIFGGWDK
ncbi:uncharacterized protein LOC123676248 [Harmonia axyridis]|uniref:uncharacterized protein LOC123676248 n=1 Tax=Harmonia axyridis TaxID=115357 RepID=UPI001E274E7B|nr:uncharacterized protein LOC123676248 [Harmonia axyridis]